MTGYITHGKLRQPGLASFSQIPATMVLQAHFDTSTNELQEVEERLIEHGLPITYDPAEARLFLSKIAMKKRAVLELKSQNVFTEPVDAHPPDTPPWQEAMHSPKRLKIDADEARPDPESEAALEQGTPRLFDNESDSSTTFAEEGIVHVVRLSWFESSLAAGKLLPVGPFTVYAGRLVKKRDSYRLGGRSRNYLDTLRNVQALKPSTARDRLEKSSSSNVLERTAAYGVAREDHLSSRRFKGRANVPRCAGPPPFLHESTSDHEGAAGIPEPPNWVVKGLKYACQRSTPVLTPNADFVDLLKEIRLTRTLQSDEIGVRAYSTTIAAISAYPHTITHTSEVARLPGCNEKTAALWKEWINTGRISEVEAARADERLKVLKVLYEIWGVGARGARALYDKGCRDLDDVVEFEWNSLTRVQQIGLKYYDEFLLKIPRQESEAVKDRIVRAFESLVMQRGGDAKNCRACIVGGYRRGKTESGDIDVVVSHLDERQTQDVITPLVERLSLQGYIIHNLITYTSSSQRGQATLPLRSDDGHGGHGFDSLDKGFVVWQDLPSPLPQRWTSLSEDEMAAYRKQQPESLTGRPHRRVDIIVAPWKRVGCAVLGWSAGTTFERDLRRYVKHHKGWKFDSSGIRDRATGHEIDVERRADGSRYTSIDEAERAVFEGMGLQYVAPEERATG